MLFSLYGVISCDVINIKNFREILRYFFHILATPLLLIVWSFLDQSFLVRKRLQSCIRNHLPYCFLRIAFQSKTRLSRLFCFKDIIPNEINSHLVYKFTCGCCNATYGKSGRHFFVRASEYLGMIPLTGKRVKNPKKSATFDDSLERKQQI